MKKILLVGLLPAMVSVTSCNNNDDWEESFAFPTKTINIVTDLSSGETSASWGSYQVDLTYGPNKGKISSSDLVVGAGNNSLAMAESEFSPNVNYNLGFAYFKNTSAKVSGVSTFNVTNDVFLTTPLYWFTTDACAQYTYSPVMLNAGNGKTTVQPAMIAKFQLGNEYLVRTYQQDTFFDGESKITYTIQGETETNITKTIGYRLHIENDLKSAALILYNAKFSNNPNEPDGKIIIVPDLDIEYSGDGIKVTGTEVVPLLIEAGGTTPYDRYTFNTLEFKTDKEMLTTCTIRYTLMKGAFTGSFEGGYIY